MEYYVRASIAGEEMASVSMAVRKIQYAPTRQGRQPTTTVRKVGGSQHENNSSIYFYILQHYRTSCFLRVTWSWRLPLTGSFTITEMISA